MRTQLKNMSYKIGLSYKKIVLILFLIFSDLVIADEALVVFDIKPSNTEVYLGDRFLGEGKFIQELGLGYYKFDIFCKSQKVYREVELNSETVRNVKINCDNEMQKRTSILLAGFDLGYPHDHKCGKGCSLKISAEINTYEPFNGGKGAYGYPYIKLSANLTKGSFPDFYIQNYEDKMHNSEYRDNISLLLNMFEKGELWINKAMHHKMEFTKEVGKFPCPRDSFPRRFHLCRITASYNPDNEFVGVIFSLEIEERSARKIYISYAEVSKFRSIVSQAVEKGKLEYKEKKEFTDMLK